MRTLRRGTCLLAAALMVTACSGGGGDGASMAPSVTVPAGPVPSPSGLIAPGDPSSSGAPQDQPPETEEDRRGTDAGNGRTAGPGQSSAPASGYGTSDPVFSSARLQAAVAAVDRALYLDGEVLDEATLRQILPAETGTSGEVTFDPPVCAELAVSESVEAVQGAALAGLAYGVPGEAPTVLNVAAYGDGSILETLGFIDEAVLSDCADVRMSRDGTTVTVTNTRLEISTTAEETLALDTRVSGAAGQTRLVAVSARTGSVRVVVSIPAPQDPEGAAREAAVLIDAVLTELGVAVL
ncbi:hypothetical protein FYJ28_08410 [Arthrobacter sp. BL-252-APC-1A]|uniref:hypothetical protein n=1 Tax=Arthrobacter sp. BL-252-APC-1A TaxID=2606622 RepID=UPI0012B38E8D|nr:hypothetical protein [Arthrobacter sp. BL-252-APC-1A]MSR98844.1 hypothetical protein [Arthrobacter sp. BL-252-APC-1A]